MGFLKDFKAFAMRGNVIDMAVGVIIGGAFTTISKSLNEDIISQILALFGGVDFSHLVLVMGTGEGAPVLRYGNFITQVINFLITAFVVFLLIKAINVMSENLVPQKEEAPAAPTTKKCPYCMSEIAIEATRCPHCTSQLD